MKLIEISELARRAGVTTATVRHYGRLGLLPPTSRGSGGSRLYDAKAVDRLTLIRRMRTAGLSLDEASLVLGALVTSEVDPHSAEAPKLLEQRLSAVRAHLEHVRAVERTLVDALEVGRTIPRDDDLQSVAHDTARTGA